MLLWPTIDTLLRPGQPGTTVVAGNRLGAFPQAIDGIHMPQKRLGFFSLSSSFFWGSGMQRLKSPESTLSRIDVGVASHACRANGKSLLTAAPSRVKIPSPTNDRPPELSPQANRRFASLFLLLESRPKTKARSAPVSERQHFGEELFMQLRDADV